MRRFILVQIILFHTIVIQISLAQIPSVSNKKVALIIGVKSYETVAPLQNSVNDALDMAKMLSKKGFEIIELIDPKTKKEIQEATRKYYAALQGQKDGVGLLFYSGHGMQVDGTNYLIPTSADPQLKADIEDQCLKIDYVMQVMEQAGNMLNIFIIDACRNNPFKSFARSADKGLSMVNAPKGSYVVYATKPGSVASDGAGRNGLFTSKLLKYIDEPDLNIEQVFKRVANDVSMESNESQRPWIASDFTGDFFFSYSNGTQNKFTTSSRSQENFDSKKSERGPLRSVVVNGKYGYADSTGMIVIPIQYDLGVDFKEDYARVRRNESVGYVNSGGQELIINFDMVGDFHEGLAYASNYKKYGFIDKNGKIVIPFTYDLVSDFTPDGLASVKMNDRWGHINTNGEVVTPIKYTSVGDFKNGFAKILKGNKWSFVNTKGIEICLPYLAVNDFSSGLALVVIEKEKWGFIDESGTLKIQPTCDEVRNFINGYATIRVKEKWGVIDKSGNTKIPIQYEVLGNFKEGLFAARINNKWGFLDTLGTSRVSIIYDQVLDFENGFSAIRKDKSWGFINLDGKEVIPFFYDGASSFSEGLAPVNRKSKWGFVDKTGTEVIPLKFQKVDKFKNGLCKVTLGSKEFYIDKSGTCVIGNCD